MTPPARRPTAKAPWKHHPPEKCRASLICSRRCRYGVLRPGREVATHVPDDDRQVIWRCGGGMDRHGLFRLALVRCARKRSGLRVNAPLGTPRKISLGIL